MIDLCCGAGGMTMAFEAAGFKSVLAVEIDRDSALTHNTNFGNRCLQRDIRDWVAELVTDVPEVALVIGGVPCQGHSLLNRQKSIDPRRTLWAEYMKVVARTRPLVFVMETVAPYLASVEFQAQVAEAERLGYRIIGRILDAADYGVPQHRRRSIIIGSRIGDPGHCYPVPSHGAGLKPYRTVRDAIGDLGKPGEGDDPLHVVRDLTPQWAAYYRAVPHDGGDRFAVERVAPRLLHRCWRGRRAGTDTGARLWWDRPAVTIRTDPRPDKGRYVHPDQDRPISLRESARLQGFPDNFVFIGKPASIARQIGNAVPFELGRAVAARVLCHVSGK